MALNQAAGKSAGKPSASLTLVSAGKQSFIDRRRRHRLNISATAWIPPLCRNVEDFYSADATLHART